MKKFYSIIIAGLIMMSGTVNSQEISRTIKFDDPEILTSEGFTQVYFDNCFNFGKEGEPLLPVYGVKLLLPQYTEIESVEIVSVRYSSGVTGVTIQPAGRQFPISQKPDPNYKVVPDQDVYSSSDPFPTEIISASNTGYLAGHSIGTFTIVPLQYIPAENSVVFVEEMTVNIQLKESGKNHLTPLAKNSHTTINRIKNIVENPEKLSGYEYSPSKDDDVDLLLITNNALLPHFDNYLAFKTATGFIIETITTETIYSQYTGQDEQEKIRNCIIDYYTNNNLEFVILGGDTDPQNASQDVIPHRGFFAIDDTDIPSDMYYCCLDGNWNNDGDNKWGEYNEYDAFAEIGIGRICVDNATEIQNFVNKLELYQDSPVNADIEKALMIGEELNNNPWTFGGDYKDQIKDGTSIHGFTTVGISSNFTVAELYDRDMSWNKSDVFDQFNNTGVNLLNHLGHSSPTYNMKMNNSDITSGNFQNDGINRGFAIGYSQGCYNGSFDNRDWNNSYGQDCFAEKITTIETAEVATVANSRYGWYSPGNTNSSSQYYDRQFFDAIFGEEITMIGHTNNDSKDDMASYMADEYMRWTCYELNLFGDPSMDIWTAAPTDINPTFQSSVPIGSSQIDFQTGVAQARIGLIQDGNLIGRAITDNTGNATVELFEPLVDVDPVDVSIIAHNKNRYLGSMVVISDQPYVLYDSYQLNDQTGNNNGIADFGESIDLGLGVKNVGNQPASNVLVNLTCSNPHITLTDDTEVYGSFNPGETIFLSDAFAFDVSDSIPDNTMIEFAVEATGSSTWTSYFNFSVCAPGFTLGNYIMDDASGNGNGRLDPGETVDLAFVIENTGQSAAPGTECLLTTSSGYITLNNSSVSAGNIAAGNSYDAVFSVTADPSTPVGHLAEFNLNVTSGYYSATNDYFAKVGLIVEDWETGDFSQYGWETGGNADWSITSSNPYEGTYCAKSGDIGDQQFTMLKLDYEVMFNDSIAFHVKVSSEANYDYLLFYIDGSVVGQWAGNEGWQRVSFPVAAGNHSFKWVYDKDTYVSGGQDCAWVDFIELPTPMSTTCTAGQDAAICDNEVFTCNGSATNYIALEWETSGDGSFDNSTLLDAEYTPGSNDIANGVTTLTLTVTGASQTISDDMQLSFDSAPEVYLGVDTLVCYYHTVLLDAGNPGASYLWSTGENTQTIEASIIGGPGIVDYWVQVTNDAGCEETDEITINFDACTGISGTDENTINIYPNPGNGWFTINTALNEEPVDITITDATGRTVYHLVNVVPTNGEVKLNLEKLNGGIYYLNLSNNNLDLFTKLIIY